MPGFLLFTWLSWRHIMDLNRSGLLHFKASAIERLAVERMCQAEGRKLSEMLRELVREGAAKRGLWLVEDDSAKEAKPEKVLL
jgi:hypothetical protein